MYQRLEKPGVLIECGFLSNTNEREKLVTDEYQKKIAEVIAGAIVKYYNKWFLILVRFIDEKYLEYSGIQYLVDNNYVFFGINYQLLLKDK